MKQIDVRLRSLLWAVITFQLILWLAEYWLPETVDAANYSLLAALVIQLIIPRHWSKYMIQWIATIIVNVRLFWDAGAANSGPYSFSQELMNAFIHSHPYVWYSLVTVLVFAVISDWTTTKQRTSYIVLTIIIALCIVDSFSLVIVWGKIATIVICGLLLIAVLHFAEFKRKYPDSWQHLMEHPGSVLFPLAILLSIMVFVGMQAPTLPPFLTDPYTAWKNAQGETVEKLGKGVDTSSRLSSSSGYGRDDSQLGGSFLYDHSPVMTIETTKRAYWRGESLDIYDGRGWTKSEAFSLKLDQNIRSNSMELKSSELWDQSKLETEMIHYEITMLTDKAYPVLFAAYQPERLQLVDGSVIFPNGLYWDAVFHEIEWNRRLVRGEERYDYPVTYSLTSQIPVLDEEGLKAAYDDRRVLSESEQNYIQLPNDLPQRVYDLAKEVTKDAASVYDQVRSIESYLKTTYVYTSTPDENDAKSDDFVDRFLFEVGEGYCDYFSTAMVVMLRTLDIPARWVKGFSPGESDALADWDDYEGMPDEDLLNGPGTYTVRNSNAHSWVEVYFPEYGWIPFEPTPGFSLTYGSEQSVEVSSPYLPQLPSDREEQEIVEFDEGSNRSFKFKGSWIAIGLAILIGIAIVIYFFLRHADSLRLRTFKFKKMNANESVVASMDRFLKFAAKKGLPRAEHETMREWTKHWSSEHKWLSEPLHELLALFERAKYTPSSIEKAEVERVHQLIKQLRKLIIDARKRYLL